MARGDVRDQMIRGAAELLAARGVQGTSFADVLAVTGAPRGSIYHHFPGGKEELVREAVVSVGDGVVALIDLITATSPAKVVDQFVDGWRAVLVGSSFEGGCAVAAVSVAAGGSAGGSVSLVELSGTVFASWRSALARAFTRSGVARREADDLAALCLAAVEGALVLGRAARSDEIFDAVKRQLRRLVRS